MWQGIFGFLAGVIIASISFGVFAIGKARRADARAAAAKEALENALIMLQAETKKATEYFNVIDGVVKERTVWSEKYQQMAVEYGNAQDLMMNVIESLCMQLEKLGKKAMVPPIIRTVRAEFFGRHLAPKKEGVEKPAPTT